jgi:hypothetical protein
MSHITTIDLQVKDLDSMVKACERLGLELVMGQKQFKWYGRFMGDTKAPQGLDPKDYGKCEHAIRVKGGGPQTYEIGLVKRADGKGYTLAYDYWQGGFGLSEKIEYDASKSHTAAKLRDWYAAEVARKQMSKQGFMVKLTQQNRKVQVTCSK